MGIKRIDTDALRKKLTEQYSKLAVPPGANDHARETVERMIRAIPALVELDVFIADEGTRHDNPGETILAVAEVLSHALFNLTNSIEDAPGKVLDKGEMTADHKAIHALSQSIDHGLHELYYHRKEGDKPLVAVGEVEITPFERDVGDA